MAIYDGSKDAPTGRGPADAARLQPLEPHPLTRAAHRYWSDLRVGRNLPRRDALDPARMTGLLAHSMILDRLRPGTVRIRLAGRIPNAVLGMDARGLPMRAFFDTAGRMRASALVDAVFETQATLECDLMSDGPEGLVGARMMLLPLLDRCYAPTKALALLIPDRPVEDPPRRFSILRHALLPADAPTAEDPPRPVTRFPDPAPAPAFEARETQVPWLRVVK